MPVPSRPRPARSLATPLLAVAAALLALVIWHLAATPIDTSPIVAGEPQTSRTPTELTLTTPLDGKSASTFSEVVRRPLFTSSRRPAPQEPPRQPDPPAGEDAAVDVRVVGVAKLSAGPPRALLRFSSEPVGRWVAVGETVNGWLLRSVGERDVVVEAHGQQRRLTLQVVRRATEAERDGKTQKAR